MKKFLLLLCITLSSCIETIDSIKNYPNGIIVDKPVYKNSSLNFLYIRYETASGYKVTRIWVPKMEYDSVNLGDTIK